MSIGEQISKIRKISGMTQEELGEKLNVSRQTISKWEKDISSPDLECAAALCELFQISLDDFVKGRQTVKNEEKISLQDMMKINQRTQRRTIFLLSGLFFLIIGILAVLFITALNNTVNSIEYMIYRYIATGQYVYAPANYWKLILAILSLIGIGIILCTVYIWEERKEKKDNG